MTITTQDGVPASEAREVWAHEQITLLGLRDTNPHYSSVLDCARRGFPAWRIAQAWGCSDALIARLALDAIQ